METAVHDSSVTYTDHAKHEVAMHFVCRDLMLPDTVEKMVGQLGIPGLIVRRDCIQFDADPMSHRAIEETIRTLMSMFCAPGSAWLQEITWTAGEELPSIGEIRFSDGSLVNLKLGYARPYSDFLALRGLSGLPILDTDVCLNHSIGVYCRTPVERESDPVLFAPIVLTADETLVIGAAWKGGRGFVRQPGDDDDFEISEMSLSHWSGLVAAARPPFDPTPIDS